MKKLVLIFIILCSSCGQKQVTPIRIAAIFSLSGEAMEDNSGAVEGVKFAVNAINQNPNLLNRKIELLLLDNKSTPEGSREAAKKAIEEKVTAIIGASWSSHSIEVAKVAQANKTPMITNVSTSPKVTAIGDYIFRVCFTDPYQGKGMAKFAHEEFGAKTAIIFRQYNGTYSKGLAAQFEKYFEAYGGQLLKIYDYAIEKTDFTKDLEEVKQLKPDIIYLPGHHETARIMSQANQLAISAKFLGGDGWGTPGFYKEGGYKIDEAYFSTHWSTQNTNKASKEFVQKFGINKYTIAPAALSYDAINVFVEALNKSASGMPLKEAIAAVKDFEGATGTISLDTQGDPINKNITIMKVERGKQVFFKSF